MRVGGDRRAAEAGARRHAVAAAVEAQLAPALAPDIGRHHGAVREAAQARDLARPLGLLAMHLAGAEDGVRVAAQLDRDLRGDAADDLAPADDAGDELLVHAVLQRDDEPIGRQIGFDQIRRHLRLVGLHADEGDIDRPALRQGLDVGKMHRIDRHGEFLRLGDAGQVQTVAAHLLDMFRPAVDEGDVFAVLRHESTDLRADRAGPDDCDFQTHGFLQFLTRAPQARLEIGDIIRIGF